SGCSWQGNLGVCPQPRSRLALKVRNPYSQVVQTSTRVFVLTQSASGWLETLPYRSHGPETPIRSQPARSSWPGFFLLTESFPGQTRNLFTTASPGWAEFFTSFSSGFLFPQGPPTEPC